MVGFAAEHFDGNYRFLELVALALQMTIGEEPEESAHPLIAKKTWA